MIDFLLKSCNLPRKVTIHPQFVNTSPEIFFWNFKICQCAFFYWLSQVAFKHFLSPNPLVVCKNWKGERELNHSRQCQDFKRQERLVSVTLPLPKSSKWSKWCKLKQVDQVDQTGQVVQVSSWPRGKSKTRTGDFEQGATYLHAVQRVTHRVFLPHPPVWQAC